MKHQTPILYLLGVIAKSIFLPTVLAQPPSVSGISVLIKDLLHLNDTKNCFESDEDEEVEEVEVSIVPTPNNMTGMIDYSAEYPTFYYNATESSNANENATTESQTLNSSTSEELIFTVQSIGNGRLKNEMGYCLDVDGNDGIGNVQTWECQNNEDFVFTLYDDGSLVNKKSNQCVSLDSVASTTTYEAENQTNIFHNAEFEKEHKGYTGDGYINMKGKWSKVQWPDVNGGNGGECTLKFRYALGGEESHRRCSILVNDVKIDSFDFSQTGGWEDYSTKDIDYVCPSGPLNVILRATTDYGGPNIDNFALVRNDGSNISMKPCGDDTNQKWKKGFESGEFFSIISVETNQCMSIEGTSGEGNVIVSACGENQQWKWDPLQSCSNPIMIGPVRNWADKSKCIDIVGHDGKGDVYTYFCNGYEEQTFKFCEDGTIRSSESGWCLDVDDHSDNEYIQMLTCSPEKDMQWNVSTTEKKTDIYGVEQQLFRIVNRKSLKCLDITGNDGSGRFRSFPCDDGLDQQFYIKKEKDYQGTGSCNNPIMIGPVRNWADKSKCIDIVGHDGKGDVYTYFCNGYEEQTFKFCEDGTIRSSESGWCLDVDGHIDNAHVHGNVQMLTCSPDEKDMQWDVFTTEKKTDIYGVEQQLFRIVNRKSLKCLDITGNDGSGRFRSFPCDLYELDQQFYIKKEKDYQGTGSCDNPIMIGPVRNWADQSQCIDPAGNDGKGDVYTYFCNGYEEQTFKFCEDGTIRSSESGWCLDVDGHIDNAHVHGNVQMLTCSPDEKDMQWDVFTTEKKTDIYGVEQQLFRIVNRKSHKCLDITGNDGSGRFRSFPCDLYELDQLYYIEKDYQGTQWIPTGEIAREDSDLGNGRMLAMSDGGETIVVGYPEYDDNKGAALVYSLENGQWTKKLEVKGVKNDDFCGYGLSISGDSTTIAIGIREMNTSKGRIKIYRRSGSEWVHETDIVGKENDEELGWSVDLSEDGNTLIGSALNGSGLSRVYRYYDANDNGSLEWTQLGNDILGEHDGDKSEYDVSLSKNGDIAAIGAPYNHGAALKSGHTRVYAWTGSSWVQMGQDIDGEKGYEFSGFSVSLSDDGYTLAIGAYFYDEVYPRYRGVVRVYKWNENGSAWEKITAIKGQHSYAYTGWSVSLSGSGDVLAFGEPYGGGHVRVFMNSDDTWTQVGQTIEGYNLSWMGVAVSLSNDGKNMACLSRNRGLHIFKLK